MTPNDFNLSETQYFSTRSFPEEPRITHTRNRPRKPTPAAARHLTEDEPRAGMSHRRRPILFHAGERWPVMQRRINKQSGPNYVIDGLAGHDPSGVKFENFPAFRMISSRRGAKAHHEGQKGSRLCAVRSGELS